MDEEIIEILDQIRKAGYAMINVNPNDPYFKLNGYTYAVDEIRVVGDWGRISLIINGTITVFIHTEILPSKRIYELHI